MNKTKQKSFYGFMLGFVILFWLIIFIAEVLMLSDIFRPVYNLGLGDILYDIPMQAGTFESVVLLLIIINSSSFIFSNILLRKYPSKISNFIYKISAIWLGFLYLFFLAFIFSKIYQNIFFNFNINNILYFYCAAILISLYGLYNSKKIRIVNRDILIKNLPSTWENKKSAFITDTHYGPIHSENDARKVVNIINEVNKKEIESGNRSGLSFLFHTGDFYDGPKMDWAKPANEYKKLDTNIKKYFVSGNHEEYAQSGDTDHNVVKCIQDAGFIIADGKVFDEDGVNIIGINYKRGEEGDAEVVKKVFENLETRNSISENNIKIKKPSIVLKHVPTNTKILADYESDLVLCGHTHNGQMFPFNFLTKYIYKGFNYGLKYEGDTQVYTSSGVGSWGPPQRLGTKSEIVVLTFKSRA